MGPSDTDIRLQFSPNKNCLSRSNVSLRAEKEFSVPVTKLSESYIGTKPSYLLPPIQQVIEEAIIL
jgi:hypothetical protein